MRELGIRFIDSLNFPAMKLSKLLNAVGLIVRALSPIFKTLLKTGITRVPCLAQINMEQKARCRVRADLLNGIRKIKTLLTCKRNLPTIASKMLKC